MDWSKIFHSLYEKVRFNNVVEAFQRLCVALTPNAIIRYHIEMKNTKLTCAQLYAIVCFFVETRSELLIERLMPLVTNISTSYLSVLSQSPRIARSSYEIFSSVHSIVRMIGKNVVELRKINMTKNVMIRCSKRTVFTESITIKIDGFRRNRYWDCCLQLACEPQIIVVACCILAQPCCNYAFVCAYPRTRRLKVILCS